MPELRIEINTIALARDGATKKEVIAPVPPLFTGATTAIRAGDLLFISGLMAVRDGARWCRAPRPIRRSRSTRSRPRPSSARSRQAEAICAAAGTSLRNAVRIQQFHSDLADLPATLEVWSEAAGWRAAAAVAGRGAVAAGARRADRGRSVGVLSLRRLAHLLLAANDPNSFQTIKATMTISRRRCWRSAPRVCLSSAPPSVRGHAQQWPSAHREGRGALRRRRRHRHHGAAHRRPAEQDARPDLRDREQARRRRRDRRRLRDARAAGRHHHPVPRQHAVHRACRSRRR